MFLPAVHRHRTHRIRAAIVKNQTAKGEKAKDEEHKAEHGGRYGKNKKRFIEYAVPL